MSFLGEIEFMAGIDAVLTQCSKHVTPQDVQKGAGLKEGLRQQLFHRRSISKEHWKATCNYVVLNTGHLFPNPKMFIEGLNATGHKHQRESRDNVVCQKCDGFGALMNYFWLEDDKARGYGKQIVGCTCSNTTNQLRSCTYQTVDPRFCESFYTRRCPMTGDKNEPGLEHQMWLEMCRAREKKPEKIEGNPFEPVVEGML